MRAPSIPLVAHERDSTRPSADSPNLDLLRAIAVLSVYIGHLLQALHVNSRSLPMMDIAQTGVLLFFVHTSLVLLLSLERLPAAGWRLFAGFYTRRFFRIYPLSIVTVVAMLALHVPGFPTRSYVWPGWSAVMSNLALTQNVTGHQSFPEPLWSLPFEVQMYVVLPFLFLLLRAFRLAWIPFALWIAAVAGILGMLAFQVPVLPRLLGYTPCFLGGVIAYRLWGKTKPRLPAWIWPLVISC